MVRHRKPASLRTADPRPGGRALARNCPGLVEFAGNAGQDRFQTGADHAGCDLPTLLRSEQRQELYWTDRLDAHLLAGKDVDRRIEDPAEAVRTFAHSIQSRAALGHHRHGVHELEPVSPWGPRIWLYREPHALEPKSRCRLLARRKCSRGTHHLAACGERVARRAALKGRAFW